MNSCPSDLMSYYCSWAKKKFGYRESIGNYFYGVILYYRNFYAFSYTIGDALSTRDCNGLGTASEWIFYLYPNKHLWLLALSPSHPTTILHWNLNSVQKLLWIFSILILVLAKLYQVCCVTVGCCRASLKLPVSSMFSGKVIAGPIF